MADTIIQIYSISSLEEGLEVARLGADHVGVSFGDIPRTPAQLDCAEAVEVFAGLTGKALAIGLTVCEDLGELFADLDRVRDAMPPIVHLSGEIEGYTPAEVGRIRERYPELQIMQALPVLAGVPLAEQPVLDLVRAYEEVTDYFLVDTKRPGATDIGATGATHSWEIDRAIIESTERRVIIAGGLGPENVAEAMGAARPYGVDSFTHTNYTDRPLRRGAYKDPARVAAFVAAVRAADARG